MSALQEAARRWSLIVRVRGLRVRRRRIALALAQRAAQTAHAEVAAREQERAQHAAQRALVLAGCVHESPGAGVWREALEQHRLQAANLQTAVQVAQAAYMRTLAELENISSMLRRETRAQEDAQSRAREIAAKLRGETY
ncbi:MAG TPA: hypothetical protein VJS30_27910 [Paraburkholderia sp.]|nr:hypothetical protein [Paraburkholderia sp.]